MRLSIPNITTYFGIALLFCLSGCKVQDRYVDTTTTAQVDKHIIIQDDIETHSLGKGADTNLTLSLGTTPTDVYILLNNHSKNGIDSSTQITHTADTALNHKTMQQTTIAKEKIYNAPYKIREINRHVNVLLSDDNHTDDNSKSLHKIVKRDRSVGETRVLYTSLNKSEPTNTTLRLKIDNIDTKFGKKRLFVWVSDNTYGAGCAKARCVTQEMVNALGDKFLKAGEDNDIYDWVTNIYGQEWGSDAHKKYSKLIDANNEIHILLTDIKEDNSPYSGAVGYFSKKDNFYKTLFKGGSNEQIMFYIDSVIFANGGTPWSIDSYYPSRAISTLAHEFQHMIHFYQKSVMLTNNITDTDTWIDEMLAVSTEDVLDTKLHQMGSRGVSYTDGSAGSANNRQGKYPLFNTNSRKSLTDWKESVYSYSLVSSFGAFLLRNYGGVKILHDIMHNSYTDEKAIMYAVNNTAKGADKSFDDLLREWGIAILLSDQISPENQPTYNTGDFTYDTYNGITYKLGSINFYNYYPKPLIDTTVGSIESNSNYYYQVGKSLQGDINIHIKPAINTEATIVTKIKR